MNQRVKSARFKRQHKLNEVTSEGLCRALNEQGYTIVCFNGIEENEDVAVLRDELALNDYMAQSRCFTYRDDKYRIVFIQEGVTEAEKIVLLAHEEGHICNDHLSMRPVFGDDVLQEYEANEFVHFLLLDKSGRKKRRIAIISVICFLAIMLVGGGFVWKTRHDSVTYTEDLYRTKSGHKYHLKDCIYIRDKKDVYRLTIEEFYSGKFEPCEACRPDEKR